MNPAAAATDVGAGVRAFVAVEPGEATRAVLRALRERLTAAIPHRSVRWVRPEQCHLTLRFLGNVPSTQLAALEQRLADAVAGSTAFSLGLASLGAFPSPTAPRVLWVGLQGDLEALAALARRVEVAVADLGDHQETRQFHPHLTLGRVAERDARLTRVLAEQWAHVPAPPPSAWLVEEVKLFRSELRPEGAMYSVLARFPLRSPA